jgi:hypothetical protein
VYTLKKQLASLPEGLGETYDRILLKINKHHRADAKAFLQWLAYSLRPLSLEELAQVVVMDFDSEKGPVYNPDRQYQDPADVLTACSSLVAKSEGNICIKTKVTQLTNL